MTPSRPRGSSSSPARSRRGRAVRTIFWTLVALGLLAAAYPQMRRLPEALDGVRGEQVRAAVARWGPLGPLVVIVLLVLHTFIPFPGEIVLAVNGALFGFWIGLAVSWVGNMLSAALAFELGHLLGPSRRLPRTVR